jgi:hypothetical protein
MSRRPTRRQFVGVGMGGVAAVGLGGAFWADLLGSAEGGRLAGGGGYGPRGAPDAHGLRLPEGFRARVVAAVTSRWESGYLWHDASDGFATQPAP